jgi:hypothetical protein
VRNDRDYDKEANVQMKLSWCTVIALSLFLFVQGSVAQDRGFGLGVILGEPTGFSAKLWTSPFTAFDFGLGLSIAGDGIGKSNGGHAAESRIHFHMDYLWHSFESINSDVRLPIYYGIGGRFNSGAGYSSALAIRGVIGVAWLPRQAPFDMFLELVPSLQFTSGAGLAVEAGIGARYYF